MWNFTFWILVAILRYTIGQAESSQPNCAIRCWENTKYVSKCFDDHACLCTETDYQFSVFQCLYSQCDTSHLNSALHHAISQCSNIESYILPALPPVSNHELLRQREAEYLAGIKLYGSGSIMDLPTQSSSFLTQSADHLTQSIVGPCSLDTPQYFSLQTTAQPAITSVTPTLQDYTAVIVSATSATLLFTGTASDFGPSFSLYISVAIVAACLAF